MKGTPMGESTPQVFPGVTAAQFATLAAKAKAAGIDLSSNSGTATKFGVEIAWEYAPENQKLTLRCLRTPFFVKSEEVNAKIQALVKESLV
jgi:predicted HTH transcriptional regulator